MRILNFGSCNIDYVYDVSHMVQPGETLAAKNLQHFPGGKGLNLSIALAKAGVPVYHAGCVGQDDHLLQPMLKENGVDLRFLKVISEPTGHAIIQVDENGENSILIYGGANVAITTEHIDEVLSEFGAGDLLFLQNEINNLPYIIDEAYKRGMRILLNPSPYREKLKHLDFHKLYAVILNQLEARAFSGETEPLNCLKVLRENYPQLHIIITLGKNGCIYADGDKTYKQPAYNVESIDTTAAGDTFSGYFVAGLYRNESPEVILRTATAAAAIATTRKGAAPSIPTQNEVQEFLSKQNKGA